MSVYLFYRYSPANMLVGDWTLTNYVFGNYHLE